MKNSNNLLSYVSAVLTTLFGFATANEITALIYSILGLISFIFSIIYTIYKWYKNAKADNTITIEEFDELMRQIEELTKKEH